MCEDEDPYIDPAWFEEEFVEPTDIVGPTGGRSGPFVMKQYDRLPNICVSLGDPLIDRNFIEKCHGEQWWREVPDGLRPLLEGWGTTDHPNRRLPGNRGHWRR